LAVLLQVNDGRGSRYCHWQLAKLDTTRPDDLNVAACLVADSAMRWRCRGAGQSYQLWRDAVNGHRQLANTDRERVAPFVFTLFGDRNKPKPEEHARGWVAQFLWFRLSAELDRHPDRSLRRLEGPGFHITEPGGDGLAIWERTADGLLVFNLWEIKNHVGVSPISGTIGRAYRQLDGSATKYLAKLTSVEAVAREDPTMNALYAQLVDLWVDYSDRAGAGVAIATHGHRAPSRCFTTMHDHFPGRTGPHQLEGLVAAVGDFSAFTLDVRERIWTPL
jgi:hypothetical protein